MRRGLQIGMLMGLMLVFGCAGVVYKYYTLDQIPDGCYQGGKLLGKLGTGGWPDLSFQDCKPTADDKAPCIVEFLVEHDRKELELLQCGQKLSYCETPGP